MTPMVYSLLVIVVAAGVLVGTGWWRYAFVVFTIPTRRMTVEKLGLLVHAPHDVERIDTILKSFAGGFNTMITRPSLRACQSYCASLPALYRAFAEEGLAMGYTLRQLFRYDPAGFEEQVVKARPEFRYLYYVGLGFWSGMRNHSAQRLANIVEGLDSLHGYLCYDGYGFKHAFFDYREDETGLRAVDFLEGYARRAAYQGVGRAFYFLYRDRPDVLIEHTKKLGEYGADVAAGVGLASVFVYPDQLEVAQGLAVEMPSEWRDDFHLGMCFALKARAINDLDEFEGHVARLDPTVQEAVYASIRECDRIELQVRADGVEEGYRCWRARVTSWMAEHVEYPLAKLNTSVATISSQPAASS